MFLNKTEQTNNLIGQEEVMWGNKQKFNSFLACLLALLACYPRFLFVIGLAGLTVDLAIGGVKSIGKSCCWLLVMIFVKQAN